MIQATGKLWLCLAGIFAGMQGSLFAAEFVPPAEGPVPFRRDRISLNAEVMNALSGELADLAWRNRALDATGLRGAAQTLALAIALNPGNENARQLVSKYKEGRHIPAGNDEQKIHRQARLQRIITWLETPQAGADGQALAACLKDILSITDSLSPQTEGTSKPPELGTWTGWVADISAFQPKLPEPIVVTPKDPEPIPTQPDKRGILLEKAAVLTSMWRHIGNDDSNTWILAIAPLQMTARRESPSEGSGFSIVIGNQQGFESLDALGNTLETLLRNQHENLPPTGQIRITNLELEKSTQFGKPQSISAAAAVLASAALTGREPDAIIIGKMDASGRFTLPSRFWDRLQTLGKGNGQRLILPIDAKPYLSSILAMEKPEFFIEYEVVLAANFKQLLELSAKSPEGQIATAAAKFREIRMRAATVDLRTFIGNSFVKQRLAAVLQDQPSHVSAEMLLTQATGNRPIWVSRKVFAAEIRRALEPMAWIKTSQLFVFNSLEETPPAPKEVPKVGETYEICRPAVDRLERYARKEDLDLLGQARELVIAVRTLSKAPRLRSSNSWESISAVRSAHNDVVRRHANLSARLDNEARE